jgi:hypothetical protein
MASTSAWFGHCYDGWSGLLTPQLFDVVLRKVVVEWLFGFRGSVLQSIARDYRLEVHS